MKKEMLIDDVLGTMSLEYVHHGIYHGAAGFVHGQLYTGVVYHLSKEKYEYLLENLEVFIRLFQIVVKKTTMRHIELMGMTLETDNGFYWELR
mgnify:FL=1